MKWLVLSCILALAGCNVTSHTLDSGSGIPGSDGGDTGSDGGAGADACPAPLTYDELNQIASDVQKAVATVAAPLDACATDADCMNIDIRAGCVDGCCVPINKSNDASYREAEKGVAAQHCPAVVEGCGVPISNIDCFCTETRCLEGHCINVNAGGLHRVAVTGTDGFCASYGLAQANCRGVEDCLAYRVPIDADCCTGVIREPDCALVNKYQLMPDKPVCAADKACDAHPRDCINGQCVFTIPARVCTADTDCVKVDTACGCMAANVSADTAALIFGDACEAGVACADAQVVCVKETCRLVGGYMDELIDLYCIKLGDCHLLGDVTVAECVQMYKKDNYTGAAQQWLMIAAAREAGIGCGGNGPWSNVAKCPYTTICP